MYKTELHCHTAEVSQCSSVSTADAVELYINKNYSSLVITNHYSQYTSGFSKATSWNERNDIFLSAYKLAKEAAKGRINILLGMEYRNLYTNNDYLVYGMTEDFVRKYSYSDEHNFLNMHLKEFAELAHMHNMLIFHAHPFRDGMTVVNPSNIDGIEILNGHSRHDSRNDIAKLWANKFKLLKCGGSDFHERGDEGAVALYTRNVIKDNATLLNTLSKKVIIKYSEEHQ
ncbi:MAG: PHP domain-containing protein [Clostridia bacterium]|nr:PHP domain-containing protein [Clostridia bacterium]